MNNIYIKKAKGQEVAVYKLLQSLAPRYNSKFSILQFPEHKKIDGDQIIMPRYDGRKYNDIWGHEGGGGTLMGLELAQEVPMMIHDLKSINIREIEESSFIKNIPLVKFNLKDWLKSFNERSSFFVNNDQYNYLTTKEIEQTNEIFKIPFDSYFIFNNGDFYPRNFIFLDKKIILIDWHTWDNNYRANIIDYWENVLVFCYIHMWRNIEWQLEYLRATQKIFNLNRDNFQKSLIIKSFEQAYYWKTDPRARELLTIFKNALYSEYIQYLIGYTKPKLYVSILKIIKRV